MARKSILCLIVVLFCCISAGAATHPGFEQMKSLTGNWSGKTPDGTAVNTSFQLISGGTALMETLHTGKEDMVTMYYPDGSDLMMTHYCMANNQPRMRASGAEGSKLSFEYVDATNLSSTEAGYMKNLVVTIVDKDHLSETWTWTEKGQDRSETFQLERAK